VLDRLVTGADDADPMGAHWQILAREARVIGVIDERDIANAVLPVLDAQEAARRGVPLEAVGAFYASSRNGHAVELDETQQATEDGPILPPLGDVTQLKARDVMRREFGIVPALFSLHNTLITLDRYDCAALPVIEPNGAFRGMISRSDAIAALGRHVRPPVVGGMATPLGVWLTTGTLSAGAPPLGLFLSGATLGLCMIVAYFAMLIPLAFLHPEWAALFVSGRLGIMSIEGTPLNLVFTALQGLIFLSVMRALPLSGVHAAEHQTVWAIERGLPLTPENVAKMPRAHPRCGTNLLALVGLIQITFQHLPTFDGGTVMITLLFIYLLWRSFGEMLQNYFTTKPATPRQLESGIAAGRALLEKYQDQPHVMAPFGARLLRSGMLYSALGIIPMMYLLIVMQNGLARWVLSLP
jgi:CBS domain-containing protein